MANTTTETKPSTRTSSNGHSVMDDTYPLTPVDVRRKRPPLLSFLLRAETLRNVVRIVTLLALDFAGLFAAILTALMVKAVILHDTWAWSNSYTEAKSLIAFAYLVTALLFARSGVYAERAQRPGLPKIVTSLFQVMVVSLIFAVVNGEQLLELLHLLRHAVLRDRLHRLDPLGLREGHGHAAAGRRLPPARAAGRLRAPHRGRRACARRRGPRAGRDGRLHLADAAAGQRAALAGPDRGPRRGARQPARAGGHHRRPRLPAGPGRRARRPVPPARRHGPDRALDDGDPRPPRGVRARHLGAAVRAAPAGLRRLRLRGQADLRLRRRPRPAGSSSARCCC